MEGESSPSPLPTQPGAGPGLSLHSAVCHLWDAQGVPWVQAVLRGFAVQSHLQDSSLPISSFTAGKERVRSLSACLHQPFVFLPGGAAAQSSVPVFTVEAEDWSSAGLKCGFP